MGKFINNEDFWEDFLMSLIAIVFVVSLAGCNPFTRAKDEAKAKSFKIGMYVTNGYCVGQVYRVFPTIKEVLLVNVNCQGFATIGGASMTFSLDELEPRDMNIDEDYETR